MVQPLDFGAVWGNTGISSPHHHERHLPPDPAQLRQRSGCDPILHRLSGSKGARALG